MASDSGDFDSGALVDPADFP
ncbi:MAG: hypothetical protein JWP83_1036, partial [Mycobacterium sp.]|nr:hypothetical protein [Mycobacterium sp.]